MTKYCVIYLKNGKEKTSPWFYSKDRAREALKIMPAKHEAILYRD